MIRSFVHMETEDLETRRSIPDDKEKDWDLAISD